MALAAVHIKVVVPLLLIHCLVLLQLFCGDFVFGPCFVVQYLVLFISMREESWFALLELPFDVMCDCWCSVSLPHGAMGFVCSV